MAIAMKADKREQATRGELRQLRLQGKIPGVIYGKQIKENAAISVDGKELQALLRSHPNAIIDVSVASGGKKSVMVADVQRDPLSRQVLHVDFHQINMNENVKANVRVATEGDSQGVREGGILQMILHELEIQCLPSSIPDAITVDVGSLLVGESLLVHDIKLPEGIEVLTDSEQVVVTILAPQKELTEEEAEAAAVESAEAEARSEEELLEGVKKS